MNKKIKKTLKKSIIKISKYTGITNIFYKLNKNRKIIIAYHNVIPDEYFNKNINLDFSIKESELEKQIQLIKKRCQVGLNIYDNNQVTITFDDGYLNQYSIASKILDKHNLKGYFFYCANLLEQDTLLIDKIQYWIDYVKPGIYTNDKYNIKLEITDNQSRRKEYHKINKLIKEGIPLKQIHELLNNMCRFEDIKIEKEFYKLRFTPIKKEQLQQMKLKGHKIGAHSSSHNILSKLTPKQLDKDIQKCRELLDQGTYNTDTFCYPFGGIQDISESVKEKIKEKGFVSALAFTNEVSQGKYGQYFIPRMTLPMEGNEDLIDFVLSGLYHFFRTGKLLPKIKI
jgi:peptidoglycan/xylan/chitin deacetylase (PgdA/CDA1 family)